MQFKDSPSRGGEELLRVFGAECSAFAIVLTTWLSRADQMSSYARSQVKESLGGEPCFF